MQSEVDLFNYLLVNHSSFLASSFWPAKTSFTRLIWKRRLKMRNRDGKREKERNEKKKRENRADTSIREMDIFLRNSKNCLKDIPWHERRWKRMKDVKMFSEQIWGTAKSIGILENTLIEYYTQEILKIPLQIFLTCFIYISSSNFRLII